MQVVHMNEDGDAIELVLPNGQTVTVAWSYLEPGDQYPELEIYLPEPLAVNCWAPGLVPAPAVRDRASVRLANQLCIPITHGFSLDE